MLSKEILKKVRHAGYWKKHYTQWGLDTWDQFYFEQYPNVSKQESHDSLGNELEVLKKNLDSKTRKGRKVLYLTCQLKVSVLCSQECKKLTSIVIVLQPILLV